MSVGATLVVGTIASKIFKTETREDVVTRFNEKTGKPYQLLIKTTSYFVLGRQVEDPCPAEWIGDFKDLGLYNIGEGHDLDSTVVGLMFTEVDDLEAHGSIVEVPTLRLAETVEAVKKIFSDLGADDVDVRTYLVGYCSI